VNTRRSALVALALLAVLAAPAYPQGVLIGHDREMAAGAATAPLAIRSYAAEVTIKDTVAKTKIDQVFVNSTDRPLEGTFYYPLPQGAVVSEFTMYIGSTPVKGELVEQAQARGIYNEIVRKTRDPAILEYAGRNLLKMDVFPIEARSDKRIILEYGQQLPIEGDVVRFVHPLDAGKMVKYPVESLSVACSIESSHGIKAVYSPSHEIDTFREGDHKFTAGVEASNVVTLKDFTLFYTLSDADFGLSVLSQRPSGDEDGYFMLLLAPKQEFAQEAIQAKTVVFVFDTSGSMSGEKIEQARNALTYCLGNLGKDDRFNVVTFSTAVSVLSPTVLPATPEEIAKAKDFVGKIAARGGTNIEEALKTALASIDGADGPTMVVFMTDGLPTVGVRDIDEILKNVAAANAQEAGKEGAKPKSRVFVFGVGDDVNTHLLDKLASSSEAASQYVLPGEDIEVAVSTFYEKVSHPVMTDVQLDFGDVYVHNHYPQDLPDLFKGSQLTVFGRYRGAGEIAVKLLGDVGGKQQEYAYDARFAEVEESNDFVPRLWATRRIGHLLDEIRLHGETSELRDEVVALGKEWGLVTPYTSYLVLDEAERARYRNNTAWGIAPAAPATATLSRRWEAERLSGLSGTLDTGMMGPGMTPGGRSGTGAPGMMGGPMMGAAGMPGMGGGGFGGGGMMGGYGYGGGGMMGGGGPMGPKGDRGATGPAGPAGPKGEVGAMGDKGDRGPGPAEGEAGEGVRRVFGEQGQVGPADSLEPAAGAFRQQTGRAAVELAQALGRVKQVEVEGGATASQRAGGRTFYYIDGLWVDSALEEGAEITLVQCLSDAYFALAGTDWVAQCLALGERVVIVLPSGKVIQTVTEEDAAQLKAAPAAAAGAEGEAAKVPVKVVEALTADEVAALMKPAEKLAEPQQPAK